MKLPKLVGITPYQAIIAGKYFEYKKWLQSEWAQKQLQNGSVLSFKSYYGIEEKDLPSLVSLSEYEKIFYEEQIDSYCSSGRKLDEKILNSSVKPVDKEKLYYLMTSELIKLLKEEYKRDLEDHKLLPVYISNAYIINEKDRKELIPIEGLELEFSDGTIRRISSSEMEEDQLFASSSYYDSDSRRFEEAIVETLDKIETETDWDKEYVVYFRSY